MMSRDLFRRDLYARLAGFVQHLPRLKDRREDMGLLLAALLPRVNGIDPAQISLRPEAARALLAYDWPLNIRELSLCLATAAVLADDGCIALRDLPEAVRDHVPQTTSNPVDSAQLSPADRALRAELLELLQATGGNVSEVARRMSKARQQIQRWLKRLGIDPAEFKAESSS